MKRNEMVNEIKRLMTNGEVSKAKLLYKMYENKLYDEDDAYIMQEIKPVYYDGQWVIPVLVHSGTFESIRLVWNSYETKEEAQEALNLIKNFQEMW